MGQWVGEHSFVISGSVTRHDMIIGRDFFKAHGVVVDHANDSITVDGLNININTLETISTDSFSDNENINDSDQPTFEISILEKLDSVTKQLNELKSSCNAFKELPTEIKLPSTAPYSTGVDAEDASTCNQHES